MRPDLPPAPPAIAALPCDERGFPIPWFVHIDEQGVSDFRVIGYGKIERAVRDSLCWICGRKLRRIKAFVIGPMCVVNRVSAEPPSHPECAAFAVAACPFLTRPMAKRNHHDMPPPEALAEPPGIMIERNPGVTVAWWTEKFTQFDAGNGGKLFHIGRPVKVQWFAHGRLATREEALVAISTGLPTLQDMAALEGPEAINDLIYATAKATDLIPAA